MSDWRAGFVLGALAASGVFVSRLQAGEPGCVGCPVPAPTARVVTIAPQPPRPLGTFTRTPWIMVRGNGQAGGGYTPLNQFGDANMTMYGPISAFRSSSAPILVYTRGYDGRTLVAPGTSFSQPLFPRMSPVIYPTQATNYYGFRQSGSPPWWANGINWLDQN
jgi:hypothetical protein